MRYIDYIAIVDQFGLYNRGGIIMVYSKSRFWIILRFQEDTYWNISHIGRTISYAL